MIKQDNDRTGELTSTVGATQTMFRDLIVIDSVNRGAKQRKATNQVSKVKSTVNKIGEKTCDRSAKLWEQLKLESGHLGPEEVTQIKTLLETYTRLCTRNFRNGYFVHHTAFNRDGMPFTLRHQVDKLVQEMLAQGVIKPFSSPWASPVVLVRMKDGTTLFCVDYRVETSTNFHSHASSSSSSSHQQRSRCPGGDQARCSAGLPCGH